MSQRRDSRANAERIVEATRQLWKGQGAPSLEQIAATAGVGIATLYRHFPNRAALEGAAFTQIFNDEIGPIIDRAAAADQVDLVDVAEQLIAVIGRYAAVFTAIELPQVTDEALETLAERFLELIRDGQEEGVLRRDLEPVDLFWVLRMLVLGLTSPVSSPTVRRRYLALVMPSLTPEGPPLPPLTRDDYERFGVAEERRGPMSG
ncbi:TetR/AcrR family transcriptional regulator [Aeromicrobium camelliae]|uniref:TetR/AcrR family transcriptional regulator n=1 Tax=Aeromicrobium camelliae TaxID=1538144 RepID=A0A3N6YHX8_9ACTN|nr:TetR/AcrR family transcriptional regulator [Aeromicrobium camelliae]RQN09404.1 TetR/AcrR family transcriptional regulator [Aeromicrobium camelliae]